MELKEIGKINVEGEEMFLQISKEYIRGIQGLGDFSHIDVLWWFDKCDNNESRRVIEVKKPYKKSSRKVRYFFN